MSEPTDAGPGSPEDGVRELVDTDRGVWEVSTESGSVYVIDLDERMIQRVAAEGARRHPVLESGRVLREVSYCRVGEPAHFKFFGPFGPYDFMWADTMPVVAIRRMK